MTAIALPVPRVTARRGLLRRALNIAATLLTVAALAAWFTLLRPTTMGGPAQYVVIHGNSMYPTYLEGDLIVTHRLSNYHVGEVIAYSVPRGEFGAGHIVIHRIVGGDTVHGLTMKGDNNPSADPWHPTFGDVVGATWVRVPRLGRALVAIHQPLVLAGIAAVLMMAGLIRREVRMARDTATQPEPATVTDRADGDAAVLTDRPHGEPVDDGSFTEQLCTEAEVPAHPTMTLS